MLFVLICFFCAFLWQQARVKKITKIALTKQEICCFTCKLCLKFYIELETKIKIRAFHKEVNVYIWYLRKWRYMQNIQWVGNALKHKVKCTPTEIFLIDTNRYAPFHFRLKKSTKRANLSMRYDKSRKKGNEWKKKRQSEDNSSWKRLHCLNKTCTCKCFVLVDWVQCIVLVLF